MAYAWKQWAPLPLRLVLGFGFAYHGFPKLFSGAGHDAFVATLEGLAVPAPGIVGWAVGILEFFGGLALIVGAFVTIVGVLGILEMLVALFAVHLPAGFSFMNITGMTETGPQFGMPGFEVPLLYIAGFAALALGGAGIYSVDRARGARTTSNAAEPSQDIGATA